MKLFIKTHLIFIVFLGVFYSIALFYWNEEAPKKFKKNINYRIGSYGHMFTRVNDIPNYNDIDILFLGSSHSYRGFDVRVFENHGYTCFNLGSSAQTPIQTEILLKRYLKTLNPEIVVYEVYPGSFCSDGVEAAVDLIANDENDWYSFLMTLKMANIKVANTFLYGLSRDVFNLNSEFIEPVERENAFDTYVSGGYVEKKVFHYKPKEQEEHHWKFDQKQIEAFNNVVEFLYAKDVNVVFIYAPITRGLYQSYTNNSSFDSILSPFENYYNFNENYPLNDAVYFYDEHHLNQDGVEMFNQKLIEVVDLTTD